MLDLIADLLLSPIEWLLRKLPLWLLILACVALMTAIIVGIAWVIAT